MSNVLSVDEMLEKFNNGGYKEDAEMIAENPPPPIEEDEDENEEEVVEDNTPPPVEEEEEDEEDSEEPIPETNEEEEDVIAKLLKSMKIDSDKTEKGKLPYKHNGEVTWVTPEEYASLANKGADYTKKTQILSKYKNSIKAMEDNGITEQDLKAIELFKKGSHKEAIAMLASSNKVSHDAIVEASMDMDDEYISNTTYNPEPNVKVTYDLMGHMDTYPADIREKISEFWVTDAIPESFKNALGSSKSIMNAFAEDVEKGIAQRVVNKINQRLEMEVSNLKKNIILTDPNEYINFYLDTAKSLSANQGRTQTNQADSNKTTKSKVDLGRANHSNYGKGQTTSNTRQSVKKNVVEDILSMSDEERNAIYMEKFGINLKR